MPDLTGVTKYFATPSETYSDTLSSSISAGTATVPVNNPAVYDDGDVVVLTVEPGTANQATFTGTKSGSQFINCIWTEGNVGIGHTLGATIQDYDSATHFAMVTRGILEGHNEEGTHKTFTESNIIPTAAIQDNAVTGAKIASYKVARQNNTTNITESAAKIVSGWGAMVPGVSATASETVTFPSAFTNIPIVVITFGGDQASGTIALGGGGNNIHGSVIAKAYSVTTSSFVAYIAQTAGNTWSTGNIVYYHWVAIGV